MSETVQTIADRLSDECGLPRYSNIFGNSEVNARKILNAIKDGLFVDAYRDRDWEMLKKEDTITLTGGGVTTYALADDFERLVNGTLWDETDYCQVRGPVDVREWQEFNKGLAQLAGLELVCKIQGDSTTNKKVISFYPDTTASTVVSYYYISSKPVLSSGSVAKDSITSSDDGFIVPDRVVYAAAKWRLLRMLGMSFQDERLEYMSLLDDYAANDSGGKKIRMDRKLKYDIANIPEVGFGS